MITLYTTGCAKCEVLKKKLDSANIEYVTFTDSDEMIDMGLSTMPVLEVDGDRLPFKQAVDWINERTANEY